MKIIIIAAIVIVTSIAFTVILAVLRAAALGDEMMDKAMQNKHEETNNENDK